VVGGVDATTLDEGEADDSAGNEVANALHAVGNPTGSFSSNATNTTRGFFGPGGGGAGAGYGNDLVGDAERYARLCVALTRREQFDVIHAHDWLTYPAGVALARVTGKPLVVHVHSTEFDRSGSNVNQRVYDIERMGMHEATRVLCVSGLTKNICMRRYAVPESKIDVVYNGLDREAHQPMQGQRIESSDKIVLFLGRITMQKGPEYFIAAAKRVLEKVPDAKFVLAGSGDMALRMIDLAAGLGIGGKVLFTGFLRGGDIERVFKMADCYVMPSVSEPFGIAALEAISHDVPVILSKTSGAAEVLQHVLKVDFWDIDDMANKIVAVLRHPPLSSTLRQHGQMELQRLTWDDAAKRCVESYEHAMQPAERVTA
jgi:glycosyltransferase involved in cell wall biosynthesis